MVGASESDLTEDTAIERVRTSGGCPDLGLASQRPIL